MSAAVLAPLKADGQQHLVQDDLRDGVVVVFIVLAVVVVVVAAAVVVVVAVVVGHG